MSKYPQDLSALTTAQTLLLTPWGITEAHLSKAMGEIFTRKADYADLYFEYTRSEHWSLDEGIVKAGSFSIHQGVGVRAVAGEKTAFAYADTLSPDSLFQAACTVKSIADQGAGKGRVSAQAKPSDFKLYQALDPVASLPAQEKIDLLKRVDKITRALDSHITQVRASLSAEYDVVLIVVSDGKIVADIRPLVSLNLNIIVEKQGRREVASAGGGGRYDLNYFTDEIITAYAQKAVNEAITNLQASPAPAGEMTVVLGAGWPGILLHEAVGHGLEGDFNRKGSSVFSGRIGQRVASKGVTVVDDGTISQRRGSLNIDDEGNTTQRNILIEDGILKGYMQDTLNARLMKTAVTGNGRRESYAHLPMPRMTNTFMLSGKYEHEEIIASVKKGLYAANFGGGQVDITSGKFTFSASEAWLIEDGQITRPVKGATLIGNGLETMNRISMIGNNLALDTGVGTCGKNGQAVPVGVGMPTIKVDGLTVGGTSA